jgi:hypothetical protein
MDEKTVAMGGAVATIVLARNLLRPAAKLVVKGGLTVADATASTRRELSELYREARDEYRAGREATVDEGSPARRSRAGGTRGKAAVEGGAND